MIWSESFTKYVLMLSPDQIFRPFTHIVLAVFVSRDLFSFEWELLTMCRRLEVTKANKNI